MKHFLIALVVTSFLVACGSSPTPQIQNPPLPDLPPLERIMGIYTGSFTLEEPFTLETPPTQIGGDVVLTLKKDGSITGTAQKKFIKVGSLNRPGEATDPEEGIITGKIIEISEFGTSGTLELEVIFPISGTFAGENDWTNNGNFFVTSFYEKNIDDSFFTKFEITAINESLLE